GIIFIGTTLYKRANLNNDGLGDGNANNGDEIIRDIENNNDGNNDNNGNADDNAGNSEDGNDDSNKDDKSGSEFEVVTVGDGNVPHSELNFTNAEDPIVISFEPTADTYVDVEDVEGNWLFIDTVAGGTTDEVDVT